MHINQLYSYKLTEHTETKIKNTIPHKIVSNKMNHLAMHLTKYIQDLYAKNYKLVIKEILEDLNK